jgi:hypothetical protein
MPAFPNYYFDKEGTPDAGEYIDPNTGILINPANKCNTRLDLPCNLPNQCNIATFSVTKENCQFNMCEFMNAIKGGAAAELLEANKLAALTPALTATQTTKANEIATALVGK